MARITILMPVYNGEKFLNETMDSVLKQTYTDFLFLIINDGSTDRTEEIIQSYQDKRIIYHKNPQNMGLVATLNTGIDLVDTEFMARMDADDVWVETKLEKQIKLLDARPEVGICGTCIRKFGAYEGDFYFPQENAGLKVGFVFFCCMSHPSVVFRMSFLKESGIRYRADYFPAEDYKIWLESLKHTQIYNIQEKLVFYRQHTTQITQGTNLAQTIQTNRVRLEVLAELSSDFSDPEKDFHLNRFLESDITSNEDYTHFVEWTDKLLKLNVLRNYPFNVDEMKRVLKKHIQAAYLGYIRRNYFDHYSVKKVLNYLLSFNWVRLSARLNLKLVLGR